jgi:hypothetical protein
MTNIILNPNTAGILTGFLSTDDKTKLRSTSQTFREAIPDIPVEAKTFLAFERKLPLIREIIRNTELYWRSKHGINDGENDPPYSRREILRYCSKYVALATYILSAGYALSVEVAAKASQPTVEGKSLQIPPERTAIVMGAMTLASISLIATIFLCCCTPCQRDLSIPVDELWNKLGDNDFPRGRSLETDAARLEVGLQAPNRQAAAYQAPGGLDKYYAKRGYTNGGLDQAFHEVRSAYLPRGAIINFSSLR